MPEPTTTPTVPVELLTARQVAGRLNLDPKTIERMGRTGRIPRIPVGGRAFRYDLSAVLEALEAEHAAEKGAPVQ